MKCIKMGLKREVMLSYMCLLYIQHISCTITCDFQPEKPVIGEIIQFNCVTIGPVLNGSRLRVIRPKHHEKSKKVSQQNGKNGELHASYEWTMTAADFELEIKCREKFNDNTTNVCALTIPKPIAVSDPTFLPTIEITTDAKKGIPEPNVGANSGETQLVRPTPMVQVTSEDFITHDIQYITTYQEDYNDILDGIDEDGGGLSLFELYPTIFWGLVVGMVTIFFVVIIATMCLVFLTQSKRRKENMQTTVPYTGSMEILTGPFRKPAGAYLDLNESSTAQASTSATVVDRACQTIPCNLPWLAVDVDNDFAYYEPQDLVARPASVAGCGNLEIVPNVLGSRGGYIQTKHGLARSESDRRYSELCRTRTDNDPQFYIPPKRIHRHSDHEMYHMQKYNSQLYDEAPPVAVEFEPVRRYKRRANQIAAGGTRQSRPYSYIDPSIAQLVPPSASGKRKAGSREELSDSSL